MNWLFPLLQIKDWGKQVKSEVESISDTAKGIKVSDVGCHLAQDAS